MEYPPGPTLFLQAVWHLRLPPQARAPDHFGVNVFCLDGFDPASVSVRPTEGANMTVVDPQARAEWPGPRVSIG